MAASSESAPASASASDTPSPPSDSRDSATIASPQVCLFSFCEPVNLRGKRYHDVYVFDLDPNHPNPNLQFPNPDLDDPHLISVSPSLRIECDYLLGRCIVNSVLYLFEGSSTCEPEHNSVHTFDLSSLSSAVKVGAEPKVMSIDDMETCPPMKGLKSFPCAILTPDRRNILVFSSRIIQVDPNLLVPDGRECFINFEMFDHSSKKWVELPPFPHLPVGIKRALKVVSYYFVDDSTFVIHLKEGYSYSLNLNGDGEWKTYDGSTIPLLGEITLLGDSLCVCTLSLYNRNLENCYAGCFSRYPMSLLEEEGLQEDSNSKRFVVFLTGAGGKDEDDVANICAVYVEFDEEKPQAMDRNSRTMYPRVYIDLQKLDLAAMDTVDDDGVPKLTPTKTISYKFDVSIPYVLDILARRSSLC